jgi:class III poly(R)-hydroxyalkanoic acid synthase PhaE subunit
MTEKSFWNDDWMALQRNYWEQWMQFQKQALGESRPDMNPWQSAMDHWWQAVNGSLPGLSRDFMEKIMDQGKSFFRMAEEFSGNLGTADSEGWKKLADSLMGSFSQAAKTASGTKSATGFWEMPLDNWNRMASALSPVPGDMLRGMPTTGVRENVDLMLGAPGLGYTRESQEQYQSLSQSLIEYQEALAEYSLFFTRMGEGAAKRLTDLVGEKPVESARDLYDSWVHCCEEEYAEQVMTPEYLELHGRMVNALMQVKHRWGELLSEYLSAMNIPTQEDLRTLQRRVQEHRRELHALRREMAAIRKAMQGSAAPAAAPAAKRAPAKKKAVARKKTAARNTTARKKTAAKKS